MSIVEIIFLSTENVTHGKMFSSVNNKFNEWLNTELAQRGWNQSDLARAAGLGRGTISNVLNNTRKPGMDICIAIADALHIPPETVMRAAGLLPPKPNNEVTLEEWHYLLEQLSDQDREELKAIALMKIERQQQAATRRRPAEGTP